MNRQQEKITALDRLIREKWAALYARLSRDDDNEGDSNSISHQDAICQGAFLQKLQIVRKR